MVTVRETLVQSGIAFTSKDASAIGVYCKMLAVAGEYKIVKAWENVDGETILVNGYPDDFKQTIISEIIAHFQKKSNG